MGGAAAAAAGGQAGQETRPSWTIGTCIIDMCVIDTCIIDTHTYIIDTSAWVTQPERPKGEKDEVKEARRATD